MCTVRDVRIVHQMKNGMRGFRRSRIGGGRNGREWAGRCIGRKVRAESGDGLDGLGADVWGLKRNMMPEWEIPITGEKGCTCGQGPLNFRLAQWARLRHVLQEVACQARTFDPFYQACALNPTGESPEAATGACRWLHASYCEMTYGYWALGLGTVKQEPGSPGRR